MKNYKLFISIALFFLVTILIISSCSEAEINMLTTPNTNIKFEKKKVTQKGIIPIEQVMDTFIVVKKGPNDKSVDCSTYWENGWLVDHFKPKSGKYLGIWPTDERVSSDSRTNELKNVYGFTKFFIRAYLGHQTLNRAMNAGFSKNKVIVHLNKAHNNPPYQRIDDFNGVMGYYVDEPYSGPDPLYTLGEIGLIYSYIHTNTNSLFYIGDFKPSNCLDVYVSNSDRIFYSSYKNGWEVPINSCIYIWWPEDLDQRPMWQTMKDRYGNKNSSNWVAAHLDQSEYRYLLGKAKNLGLNTVWYYQAQDTPEYTGGLADKYSSGNIKGFCNASWESGFLRRFSQYVRIHYKYFYDNDCEKCHEWDPDDWYIDYIEYFGIFREDFVAD